MTLGDRGLGAIRGGLGLYPGDPCFDTTRPAWLPYWIDDFTESDCFYGGGSIFGDVLPAAGYMAGSGAAGAVGGVTQGLVQGIGSSITASPYVLIGAGVIALVAFGMYGPKGKRR